MQIFYYQFMNNIENLLHTIFSPYIADPKWYPFVLIGIAIFVIFVLYLIFMYIRSFVSWFVGVSELVRLQKEQNNLLRELIAIQDEQKELMEALFVENATDESEYDDEKSDIDEDENLDEENDKKPTKNEEKQKKKWFSK